MKGSFISRRKRKRAAGVTVAVIAMGTVVAFLAGFWLFWMLGSRVAGGDGLALRLPGVHLPGGSVEAAIAAVPSDDTPFDLPVVDIAGFRDLSYVPVKGIHLTSWAAGSSKFLPAQLELADATEINAMVIDLKEADGYVAYDSDVSLANELELEELRIKDIDELLATLREHGIVPIARIVCFKDPLLAARRPDLAVKDKNGGVWKDRQGRAYVNPYDRRVWEYLVELGEDAADRGFREIQFDYVRFPSDGKISNTVYPDKDGSMEDAIAGFLAFARERLAKKGVWVSADVFGLTVYVKDDLGIGQKIDKVARNVDIVSPMIYPSHYETGSYGQKSPNAAPYEIITAAMKDAGRRLDGTGAIVRPWLQDFSLDNMPPKYGVEEVRAQIRAVEDLGYREWILWDPSVSYTEGALAPQ